MTALRAFDATARHGGFAAAARSLNVTHAAIAQQVRALEAEIGVALATRQGRNVHLTEAGNKLAIALSDGFMAIADGVNASKESAASRALRVTTTPFLTDHILMPRLSEFWQAHDGVEISLYPSRAYVDIVQDGFDLAIRAVPAGSTQVWKGVEQHHVGRVSLIGIASPTIFSDSSKDPQQVPWLWHDGMGTKLEMMRHCGLDIENLTQIRIGSPNLLLEAVRQGLGATIFNEQIARQAMTVGEIVEVPLPRAAVVDYYGITPLGPQHPMAVFFLNWVKTLL